MCVPHKFLDLWLVDAVHEGYIVFPIGQNKWTLQTSAEKRLAPVGTAQVYSAPIPSVQLQNWVKQNMCTTFFDGKAIATTNLEILFA